MPPASSLPVAPNHASLSNRISLLLAQRAAVLSPLLPAHTLEKPQNQDLSLHAPPNAGVGYVGTTQDDGTNNSNNKALQRRLLKRSAPEDKKRDTYNDDDDDDDQGRTGLGRTKKAKLDKTPPAPIVPAPDLSPERTSASNNRKKKKKKKKNDARGNSKRDTH